MDILFGAVLFHRSVRHAAQVFAEEGDGLVQHLAVVTERQLKVANAVVSSPYGTTAVWPRTKKEEPTARSVLLFDLTF
ncbi:MAG: hypothetical protein IKM52_01990 [Clostridia bacterium]|nr:hypothetical protein [Clostridia bacterium]